MSKDINNPLYGVSLKCGMTKYEVNKLLGGIIELKDDVYKGKRYEHTWVCECGNEFNKKWQAMQSSRFSCFCKKCQSDKLKEYNAEKKNNQGHKVNKDYTIVFCKQCGRPRLKYQTTRGLCEKHYKQFRKFGKCIDSNPHSLKDKNEIIINENKEYAEIILRNKNSDEIARAKIDIDDIERVSTYKWSIYKGYVGSRTTGRSISLHRFIMDCVDSDNDKCVDHINHDVLDNRKENLRVTTLTNNGINKVVQTNSTCGVTGVYNTKGLWHAQIKKNGKTIPIGSFKYFTEAIEARRKWEKELFGEYSINEIIDDEEVILLKDKLYEVEYDARIDIGVYIEDVNKYVCYMYPIKNGFISFDKIMVEKKRIKSNENLLFNLSDKHNLK